MGVDYRVTPVDIENVPRGAYHSNGGFYGKKFWETTSLSVSSGIRFSRNYLLYASVSARYNHMNWRRGYNYVTGVKQEEKRNMKFDFFIEAEKLILLRREQERYLTLGAGLGFTNINSGYNVTLRDTLPSGTLADIKHYEGSMLHFGPRFEIGYKHNRIKFSFFSYIVEGVDRTNLTALWNGVSLQYQLSFKRNSKGKQVNNIFAFE